MTRGVNRLVSRRSSAPGARGPGGVSGPRRILLADPDIGIQATLAVTLGGRFFLTEASNVADALDLLTEVVPDLLIVSADQPDLEAGHLVRALHAKVPACPVLLLTDADHVDRAKELIVLGINGYFLKPLRFDRLLERITMLLSARRLSHPRFIHVSTHVGRAIQYLSAQRAPIPTVRELAALVGVSVSHFTHAFSLDTGMPPKEYLTRMQIELAKRLLFRTSRRLDIIAAQLGFSNASHLSKVFRARTGLAPGRFRRRASGGLA